MASTCVLSLDVGTSSVRAAFYDERGDALPGTAQVHHQVDYLPDGGVETAADALLAAVGTALDRCLQSPPATIAAVGISCFWHSLLGVDAGLRPVTPLLIWADTRSAPDVGDLSARLDGDAVRRRTGCRLHSSYPAAKLAWMARAHPEWASRAVMFLSFADYLTHWLTGGLATSVSMASGSGLYDQRAHRWDPEVLLALELPESVLPEVADFADPELRCIRGAAPLRGARVLLPLGDGACNNVGSGCSEPGVAALMAGTSGACRVLREGGPWDVPPSLWQYRLDVRRGLVGGALSNAGNLHQWMAAALRLPDSPERTDAAVAAMPPCAHGLTFLPLLAGERSPGWAPGATGALVGMREATTGLDMLRAGMEGVGIGFAAILADIEGALGRVRRVIGSGGALVSSPAWQQILADALGRDVERSAEPEPSARGAALMALEAVGAGCATGRPPRVLPPPVEARREHAAAYAAAAERQRRLYALLAGDRLLGFGPG